MTKGIRLSPTHGVNPSVMTCFLCGEDYGLALLGRLPGDAEAPHKAVFDRAPCPKCAELQTKGVILISVRDGEEGSANPYRTGGWVVVSEDFIRRTITPEELRDTVLRTRVAFVPDAAWRALGLGEFLPIFGVEKT